MVSPACKRKAGKPVMQPEIDIASELPLTSFSVTHPCLALVKVDIVMTTNFAPQNQRGMELNVFN